MSIHTATKNSIGTSVIVLTFLFFPLVTPVFAQSLGIPGLIHDVNNFQNQASKTAEQTQRRLSDVITHADTLITNRITTLNSLLTRIQNDTRLTASEKTTLQGQIQTIISGLQTLKTKIDADTTTAAALADGKQIFTTYRIYEVVEPQIRTLIVLNNMQAMVTKLQGLVPQIQNLINSMQSQGKDISPLTPLIADVTTQLQTINTTITTDITTIQNISPTTTTPQTTFTQVRNDIQNIIKTSFQKVRQDIQQMRQIFHNLILPNDHPSNQPVPSQTVGSGLVTGTPTPTILPSTAVRQ